MYKDDSYFYSPMKKTYLLLAGIFALCACNFTSSRSAGSDGSGTFVSKEYSLSGFDALDFSGAFELEITQQEDYSIELEVPDYLEPYLRVSVNGHTLHIGYRQVPVKLRKLRSERSRARIGMPHIGEVDMSGASKLMAADLNSPELEIECSGASEIQLSGKFGKFSLSCSGASKSSLEGSADEMELECSGASRIEAVNFLAKRVDIEVSGASSATVNASESLEIECSGASRIRYKASPETRLRVSSSGASKVSEF